MESHRLDPDTVMLFPGGGEAPLGAVLGLCRGESGLAGKVAVIAPLWPERVVRDGGGVEFPECDRTLHFGLEVFGREILDLVCKS